ncbi:MAG TPA: CHAT domain-containing protein, partial [Terricaulis sp.]|nr:CHAT domain-containing protein [Terricaulis sp.]
RTEFDFAGARALYQAVLAPFEADLRAAGVTKISYSLPSQLATIPLAVTLAADPSAAELQAASRNDFSGLRWAGRDFVFSQAVSASSFVSLRGLAASQARTPFLGYGDFLPAHQVRPERLSQIVREAALPPECVANLRQRLGQARLPGTAAELTQVRALLNLQQNAVRLGADFTDQSVRGDGRLGDARVVMFATHGLLNEDNCFTEPALITSLAPDSGDGFLEISDIAEMQLNADLAILSACDTAAGRGSGRDPGEAFDGLARAFFYAGARSVLASHWRVFDSSASRMMRDFFVNAQQGRPVADALAQAQRGLMAQAPTSHPAHWGAMVAVGDGGRVLNFSSPI